MTIKGPKGTQDFYGIRMERWKHIEKTLNRLMEIYSFQEIRTPVFESTDLFLRGVGDTTDIVDKEMYTFKDKGDRSITLRPEGTASVARAFIEHGLHQEALPARYYYMGPMFRYSRPQTGRYRQFHQFGIEVLGTREPAADAEVLEIIMKIFTTLGIQNLKLEVNSVGCPVCRPVHREALKEHLSANFENLCPTCQSRYEKNPLRIFDCKNEGCQSIIKEGPTITDHLCEDCQSHFRLVLTYLDQNGVPYVLNKMMVRGLDYYSKTAFEVSAGREGAQSSIGGGGRYDGLIEELGGPELPGIGFAIGLERVLLTIEEQDAFHSMEKGLPMVYVANVSESDLPQALSLVRQLREAGIPAQGDTMARKLKNQFKYANKIHADYVITLGEDESAKEAYPLKNMDSGTEVIMPLPALIKTLRGEGE